MFRQLQTFISCAITIASYVKFKDIVIAKPDTKNGFIILDWTLKDKAIQKTVLGRSKFEKSREDPTSKCCTSTFLI